MADGQKMEVSAPETASLSDNQPVMSVNETPNIEQEVAPPIPGFPPFFQFAKLQTEASSWPSNATAVGTSCGENFATVDTTPAVVKTEPTSEQPVSSEPSKTVELSSVNGMESSSVQENSGIGIVMKLHEEEIEDNCDEEVTEKGELGKDEEEGAVNDEPDEEEAESDPYFYTKRDEFTSEIYKIELQNLPKKCGYKVRKLHICILSL